MNVIDKFLNNITMYRVVLYGLTIIALTAIALGFFGVIAFDGVSLIGSLAIIMVSSILANKLFAKLYNAPTNVESVYISAFILFFLLEPSMTVSGIVALVAGSVITMLSKFLFARGKRHIFNPVAVATTLLTIAWSGAVIWWVATPILSIVTLVVGLLIVRKIRRFALVGTFALAAVIGLLFTYIIPHDINSLVFLKELVLSWPFVFFATIMLTEPLTTPPTKSTQMYYGAIVGFLFASRFTFGPIYSSPELSLVLGNIYSYAVSSKQKLTLMLKKVERHTDTVYNFIFATDKQLRFKAGQYLEWTLPHEQSDTRGNRRYFTVASSPTEEGLQLGVRIDDKASSSFKRELLSLTDAEIAARHIGTQAMVASHLSGEFTMPEDRSEKIVWIAGGIGVTPFRSMVKEIIDMREMHDIVMLYFANTDTDFAYAELFNAAAAFGVRTEFIASNPSPSWQGRTGRLDATMLAQLVPDFQERMYMLSGPHAMVANYVKILRSAGVSRRQIKTDYFPGF